MDIYLTFFLVQYLPAQQIYNDFSHNIKTVGVTVLHTFIINTIIFNSQNNTVKIKLSTQKSFPTKKIFDNSKERDKTKACFHTID